MNKAELKKFAVEARRDLIDKVSLKAEQFGITQDNQEINIEENYGRLIVNGKTFSIEMKHAVHTLQQRLNQVGYDQLIEEVAYTWFNRIIAIRYMEVNNYLPDRVNVLSSSTGKNEPDILLQYATVNLDVDRAQIDEWSQKGDNEQVYRKIFVAQCHKLNIVLPSLFEEINDYTELLLPDYLLDSEFVINKLVSNQELHNSFKEVEVIGWLYQYYNVEPKDKVFAKLGKNKKAEKDEIPAATQFFTPKWIVQYMVENSLGQLWLEAYPTSELKQSLHYYIEPTEQTKEVEKRLNEVRYKSVNLEDITIIDPCVGSGHILVYAFDLLYLMYEEAGFLSRDIPKLILENNLYGLDIDERATQMASFALMMKAREKSRRILRQDVKLNIFDIRESNGLDISGLTSLLIKDPEEKNEVESIINFYHDAKNFGSMLTPPNINYKKYLTLIDDIGEEQITLETFEAYNQLEKFKALLIQSQVLKAQYDISVTNPPYMGSKGMNNKLKSFVNNNYSESKPDLYSIFIERLERFTKEYGFNSTVTQHSWMFLSSFEKLRQKINNNQMIQSLVHLGTRAFEDIGGEVVQTSTQTFRKHDEVNYKGAYVRLVEYKNSILKKENLKSDKDRYYKFQHDFQNIPGSPIAYWANEKTLRLFNANTIGDFGKTAKGLVTMDNNRFTKHWYEVNFENTTISNRSSKNKWVPLNKGGGFRKWSGNDLFVINWENDGEELKNYIASMFKGSYTKQIINEKLYFKEAITWSSITSSRIGFRIKTEGYIFDSAGPSLFLNDEFSKEEELVVLAYLNSKVVHRLLEFINPTLNFVPTNIRQLPIKFNVPKDEVVELTSECINYSEEDWNSFETSWGFLYHPLLKSQEDTLSKGFELMLEKTTNRINMLKQNEELLNRIFIEHYGLENELTPEVSAGDVTIHLANQEKDTKSFLSYFIGCLMGRYSLDLEGLVYAGGEFVESKYETFKPNSEGLIQLTDDHYFENDIIVRLREFLSVAFSPETVDKNMQWLAESLTMKKNESPEERLRRYFLDEFFKDHCKTYQKRPIYWLVDSGKQKGLRTLVYMHRYQPDTMATIRFEHLQEIQSKYQNEISMIDTRLANPSLSATDRRSLEKAKTDYQKKLDELQEFDKHLATYANEQIAIDLDDGVKVNYPKFDKVLAKIK